MERIQHINDYTSIDQYYYSFASSFIRDNWVGMKIKEQTKIRYINIKERSEISNSITKNWTDQAIRCYLSRQNCAECSVAKGNYSFACQMHTVVEILLEQIGPPEQNKIRKLPA